MDIGKPEILGLGAVLSGVIGTLWALLVRMFKRDQEDLKQCREMHDAAEKQICELHGNYNYLKGRMDGVENLSRAVLKELRGVNNSDDTTGGDDQR